MEVGHKTSASVWDECWLNPG